MTVNVKNQTLELCVDMPSNVTTLQGHIWIQPPVTAAELELKPLFTIKDRARWRVLATGLAYGLALFVTWGTGELRKRMLSDARRRNSFARLGLFLSSHPGLNDHDSVVVIRQLLSGSELQSRAGNSDLTEQSLNSAELRLEQLIASPPQPTIQPGSAEAIRVLEPQSQRLAGRTLSFAIITPRAEWRDSDTFVWRVFHSKGESKIVASGTNLRKIEHLFEMAGQYAVEVTANSISEKRDIAIGEKSKLNRSQRLRHQLGLLALLPTVVGAVLAAGAAYLTTANVASWGTLGDYFALFFTAFGLSAGSQAVSTVLNTIRRG